MQPRPRATARVRARARRGGPRFGWDRGSVDLLVWMGARRTPHRFGRLLGARGGRWQRSLELGLGARRRWIEGDGRRVGTRSTGCPKRHSERVMLGRKRGVSG